MKLVTYRAKGDSGYGRPGALLASGQILDLRKALASPDEDPLFNIAELISKGPGALKEAAKVVADVDSDSSSASSSGWIVSADSVQLLSPVGRGAMLWTVGPMYPAHMREMGMPETATNLSYALRSGTPIIGSGEPIVLPKQAPDMVDWEGELALIIGKPTYRVDPADAWDHVAGYTIYNDVGARDFCQPFIEEATSERGPSVRFFALNLLYKEFPTFSPLGPCMVTKDEIDDIESVVLRTIVNGETMQEFKPGVTGNSIADAISHVSQTVELRPGDILSLGTSEGVGFARNPPIYLKAGDEVTVSIDGIGSLTNPVVADS